LDLTLAYSANAEDPSDNRARGAETMTSEDVVVADYNNEELAELLDDEIVDDSTEFLEELLEFV